MYAHTETICTSSREVLLTHSLTRGEAHRRLTRELNHLGYEAIYLYIESLFIIVMAYEGNTNTSLVEFFSSRCPWTRMLVVIEEAATRT